MRTMDGWMEVYQVLHPETDGVLGGDGDGSRNTYHIEGKAVF